MKTIYVEDNEMCCCNCTHYYQHYVLDRNGVFSMTFEGHCATPRLKARKPTHEACIYFEQKGGQA